MSGFLGGILLFFFTAIFFILLPLGLLRPSIFSKWLGESITRSGIIKYLGTTALLTLVGSSMLMPTQASVKPVDVIEIEPTAEVLQVIDAAKKEPTVVKEEIVTKKISFEIKKTFSNKYQNGTTIVSQKGQNGVFTTTFEVEYENEKEIARRVIGREVTTEPIVQIVVHGTYVQPAFSPPAPAEIDCDPNYDPCVPYSSSDLDCGDIQFRVRVIGSDPHGFDRDNDGVGCESY